MEEKELILMNALGLTLCNKCDKLLEKTDFVALSYLNTIFHLECGVPPKKEGVQDTGTFEYILENYPFMQKV
jgi:hypothetical protein